jgi:hypothetical protein
MRRCTSDEQQRAWKNPFTKTMHFQLPLLLAPMPGFAGRLLMAKVLSPLQTTPKRGSGHKRQIFKWHTHEI